MITTDKVSLGVNGSYSGNVGIDTSDGNTLRFFDTTAGSKTLQGVLDHIAEHSINSHTDMTSDFATQYYNTTRLASFIADPVRGNTVGISGEVNANSNLGAHVADSTIHQRVPKYVLRVAKGGQNYTTIGAALAAVPTSGVDVPSVDRRWRIEVAPGVYEESVLLDKQWVEIVGAGAAATRIKYNNSAAAGTYPLYVAASNVAVWDIGLESSNPTVAENIAVLVGAKTGFSPITTVQFKRCRIYSPGEYSAWLSTNADAVTVDDCELEAGAGDVAAVRGGINSFVRCRFTNQSTKCGVAAADTAGLTTLTQCRSSYGLLRLTWCQAHVYSCFSSALLSQPPDVATGAGTLYWDGRGYYGQFTENGSLPIYKTLEADWFTKDNVVVEWGTDAFAQGFEQKHLKVGHRGGPPFEADDPWGADGPDIQFYREISLSDGDITGDVHSVGDDSVTDTGTNSTNALALFLGSNNSDGKYLRWINGDLASGTEVGYIARDGKVHAPGFVGEGSGLTFSGAVSNATAMQIGGAAKLFDDGATIHLIGRGYYAFGANSSQLYLNAPAGRFGYNNGNFEFNTHGNESNPASVKMWYNANAALRSVSIGARLQVTDGTLSAVTSGAHIQTPTLKVTGTVETGTNTLGFFGAAPLGKQNINVNPVSDLESAVYQLQDIVIAFGLATDNR